MPETRIAKRARGSVVDGLQRERVLLPVARDSGDPRAAVHAAAGAIRFERDFDLTGKGVGLHPQVTAVLETAPDRNAGLMDTVLSDVARLDLDSKRVAVDQALGLRRVRIGDIARPRERDAVVVDAVVRITLPVPRQPKRVRRFLEAAVPQELGMQAALDVLVHELHELAVQRGADVAFDLAGIDRDLNGRARPAAEPARPRAAANSKGAIAIRMTTPT